MIRKVRSQLLNKRFLWGIGVLLLLSLHTHGQQYDLLIRNGRVIDPKNSIDAVMDITVLNGKIAKVAKNIPPAQASKVIDASGLILTPGLIDIHTHVFVGSTPETFADGFLSLSPDDFTLKSGVTTVVDAGTSGWRNFPVFKAHVIDKSKTRVLAFLNIAGNGMTGSPTEEDVTDMDARMTSLVAKKYPDIIVGVKIGHYSGSDWAPFDRALAAAAQSNTPLFVECHLPQFSLEDQLKKMRSGDIITHSFEKIEERMPVVDDQGKLRSFVADAQKRGVLFDLGHGGAGFWFSVAVPAMQQGLAPNTFGSDLHRFSMNAGMKDMLNIMSKYMAIGMSLQQVVERASWNAAKSIHHEELGNLSEGSVADIAVLRMREGDFGFTDAGGNVVHGTKKLEAELTVRNGKIVWDLNGISGTPFKLTGRGNK
ncbi:MAG TPA: amidohydrolase/deacetylase family metallohydrolase [Agriterribacter sp.]|nr:amidohydrolase/deacetylase family metallohydrolase [Agriterribacter sp.]